MQKPELNAQTIDELHKFLQGKFVPEHFNLNNLPNLNEKQAFIVIYVLQEWLQLIPDNFEMCSVCNRIYNADNEGIYSGDTEVEMEDWNDAGYNFDKDDLQKHFCGSCSP